jgi:hypothetical protein
VPLQQHAKAVRDAERQLERVARICFGARVHG